METMDNLRDVLSCYSKRNYPVDGNYAWEQLTRKLDDLKERDCAFAEVSSQDPNNAAASVDLVMSRSINTLHAAAHNGRPPFAVVPSDSLLACEAAIKDLMSLALDKNVMYKNDFVKGLISTEITIPLQIIWKLQKAGILQISTYVFRHDNEALVSDAILWLLCNSEELQENAEVAKDTFASLLIASQSRQLNLPLATLCASILKKCANNIVNLVMWQGANSTPAESSIDLFYLSCPELWSCGVEAMEQFVLAHLLHLLGENFNSNSNQNLQHNFSLQEKCTINCVKESLKHLLQLIVNGLGAEKVIAQLGVAVVRPIVNWKIIFRLIAVLLSEKPECCDDLKKLTDELIQVGLEGGRQMELSAGFLIARQCCSCDSKNFGSYSLWFSSNFGINSVTARNTVQFQQLLQLLTEIVPVESAENLRVHINKVPLAPTSCHSILHDYTVLARTRLADLNESSELPGLFSDSSRDAVPGLDSKQADIVKVLAHYQSTKEIMKPVLEASVLRRLYYRNVFLVELLGLSGSTEKAFRPEDFQLHIETRHEFILALKKLGKIPDKLFQVYLEKRSPEGIRESDKNVSKETIKQTTLNQPKKKKCLDLKSRGLSE